MGQAHPSTPAQRAQWSAHMIAHQGEYGLISELSRAQAVSRPTLYAWRAQAEQALRKTFQPPSPSPPSKQALVRQVLSVWVAHSSQRDIQSCFRALREQGLSLDTISTILAEAEQRALQWLATHVPSGVRALALDEIYANDRHGAYLNVADIHSGAVWASVGPLSADSESWILLLWELQERHLLWDRIATDGAAALRAACRSVTPHILLQLDQWHLLHRISPLQARLSRRMRDLQERTATVTRQAARLAAGLKPVGRNPKTDLAAHLAEVARAEQIVADVRFLSSELRRLLEVVVLDRRGLLSASERQAELHSLLTLLSEVAERAPEPQQATVQQLHAMLREALPEVLTFVEQLDRVHADLGVVLNPNRQALLAWAWLRRKELGWGERAIVAAIPSDWREAARVLLLAWADAVRVSTAVERWHSILRPHLAVHRTLRVGQLALLVVWHNHRVFSRGIHKGKNPLHLSGMLSAPSDWLVALGYGPAAESGSTEVVTPALVQLAVAA